MNNYEFDIEYRSGTSNGNADALSRLMDDSSEQEHYEDIMINHLFGDDHIDDDNDEEGEISTNSVPLFYLVLAGRTAMIFTIILINNHSKQDPCQIEFNPRYLVQHQVATQIQCTNPLGG